MFNKNKKKIDSRIRFQSSRFTKKLENARGYKRTARVLPKNSREAFFERLELSSWISKISVLLALLFLIYIVYIPNFLFIKSVTINGVGQETLQDLNNLTLSYFDKKLPWPQKNLLLLSKNKLKDFLLANDHKILSVDSISKHFPNKITINITPRLDSILLEQGGLNFYTVSGDGLITSQVFPGPSSTLPNLPILLKLDSGDGLILGHKILQNGTLDFINTASKKIPEITKSKIDNYQILNLDSADLTISLKSNSKILLDINSDPILTFNRLNLLFSQFSDTDKKKLYYVDMRFKDKSYVCLKGTDCVKDINLPITATSTPN